MTTIDQNSWIERINKERAQQRRYNLPPFMS